MPLLLKLIGLWGFISSTPGVRIKNPPNPIDMSECTPPAYLRGRTGPRYAHVGVKMWKSGLRSHLKKNCSSGWWISFWKHTSVQFIYIFSLLQSAEFPARTVRCALTCRHNRASERIPVEGGRWQMGAYVNEPSNILLIAFKNQHYPPRSAHVGLADWLGVGVCECVGSRGGMWCWKWGWAILARPHQSINSNYYSKFITVTQINAAALLS